MQAVEILDIKNFMQLLFQTNILDSYEFVSAELSTDISYSLNGHIHKEFFNEEETNSIGLTDYDYLPWHLAKEKLFLLIKGKKTPLQLKIVLKACKSQTQDFLSKTNSSLNSNDIDGIFLNIIFQENKLNVICGISYKIFTMDKQLESEFSNSITTLFKSNDIACK
ncbi:MAG: hypothetical protein K2J90_14625 [Lachnospiraceae bacterium]|nr:hypothetical protein [Lachnospiraceae bacterium]